jgi:hypothetical protein
MAIVSFTLATMGCAAPKVDLTTEVDGIACLPRCSATFEGTRENVEDRPLQPTNRISLWKTENSYLNFSPVRKRFGTAPELAQH